MSVLVHLTESHRRNAEAVATWHQVWVEKHHAGDSLSAERLSYEERWAVHVRGILADMAAAVVLKVPWQPKVNKFKAPDLADCVYVRACHAARTRINWELPVRPWAAPEHFHVLVTGEFPRLLVHGYIDTTEAMQVGILKNPGRYGAAWFVPREYLHPIMELRKRLASI